VTSTDAETGRTSRAGGPLRPPSGSPPQPIAPPTGSNRTPHLAGDPITAFVPPPARHQRSRTRVYTVGAVVFVVISVACYIGFRSYIYGDDAPPVPVLDDLGD
jgi:hypothetical protein